MARGNWRSGENHGVAEVGSYRKIIDGWVMKLVGTYALKANAHYRALEFRRRMYLARVLPGHNGKWNVYATVRNVRTQVRMKRGEGES